MSDEQRCGLCRHWTPFNGYSQSGPCEFPVPSSVIESEEYMDASEGTNCPCFERKEASDGK